MNNGIEDILREEAIKSIESDKYDTDDPRGQMSRLEDLWAIILGVLDCIHESMEGGDELTWDATSEFIHTLECANEDKHFSKDDYSTDVAYVKRICASYLHNILRYVLAGKGLTFNMITWWELREFCEFHIRFGPAIQCSFPLKRLLNEYNTQWEYMFESDGFKYRFLIEYAKCTRNRDYYSGNLVASEFGKPVEKKDSLFDIADGIFE